MAYFSIHAQEAKPTVIEAADFEVAIARYVRLRELTGWSGKSWLAVSELNQDGATESQDLVITQEMYAVALHMLPRSKPQSPSAQ